MASRQVIVATDGSEPSKRAVVQAVELAAQAGARLAIINVIEPGHVNPAYRAIAEAELRGDSSASDRLSSFLVASPGFNAGEALQTLENYSQAVCQLVSDRVLDDAERVAAEAGLAEVSRISTFGDAAKEIVKTAEAMGADLIVLGRRGLRGVEELFAGSVSQKVLHRSAINILVVS